MKTHLNQALIFLVLMLFLSIPSLREIFKWAPMPSILVPIYLGVMGGFYVFITNPRVVSLLASKRSFLNILLMIVPVVWATTAYVLYPIADARIEIGLGSTANNAIIEPAMRFFSGNSMYDVILPGGVPASPGPGWIILNSPLVISGFYWAITAVYGIAAMVVTVWMGIPAVLTVIAFLLLSSSVIFWNLNVVGHDLVPIGLAIVSLTVLAYWVGQKEGRNRIYHVLWLAPLIALVATSRVIFLVFPVVLAALMFKRNSVAALILLLISTGIALILHIIFYIDSEFYQPLHVFSRGERALGLPFMAVGSVIAFAAFVWSVRKARNELIDWVRVVFLVFGIPMLLVAFGELQAAGWDFSAWEGANYLAFVAPIAVFWAVLRIDAEAGTFGYPDTKH